jgi:ATP-dependent exoDNAse (exonuclease V) alpha subunit
VRLTAEQLSLKRFGEKRSLISHAYAVTTYKAQGATVDNAFVLMGRGGSREDAIVQLTRSRNDLEIFTTQEAVGEDFSRLAGSMTRARSQPLAIEQQEDQAV